MHNHHQLKVGLTQYDCIIFSTALCRQQRQLGEDYLRTEIIYPKRSHSKDDFIEMGPWLLRLWHFKHLVASSVHWCLIRTVLFLSKHVWLRVGLNNNSLCCQFIFLWIIRILIHCRYIKGFSNVCVSFIRIWAVKLCQLLREKLA